MAEKDIKARVRDCKLNIFPTKFRYVEAKKPPILQPTKIKLLTILDEEERVKRATSKKR